MEGHTTKTAMTQAATGAPEQNSTFRKIVATRDLSYDGEDPGGGPGL